MEKLQQLYLKMVSFYAGDPRHIQHFVKVHSFARLIGEKEGLDEKTQLILEAAALVHDIGIRPAQEKYGSSNGKLQEKEGPACAEAMLEELGFEVEEFGENTLLLRQIPMDLGPEAAAEALETRAGDLLNGRRESKDTVRDTLLHTVACKAAIKAGWKNDEKELLAVAEAVMAREDLKYCPHGRPICVSLSKKQLEKQFKRS